MPLAVQNPATGRETFHVDDVPAIMALADTAQRQWAKVPPRGKAEILRAGFSGQSRCATARAHRSQARRGPCP